MRLDGLNNGEESKVVMLTLVDDGSIGGSRHHCHLDTRHQDNAVEQMRFDSAAGHLGAGGDRPVRVA